MIKLELHKFFKSRLPLVLLIGTGILFPILVKVVANLSATTDNVPEGLLAAKVAEAILVYAHSYFFVPVWILILIGIEFSNGHVNKVVFIKSRTFYFDAKLVHCLFVTALFTLLAAISFVISVQFSPYQTLHVEPVSFLLFLLQFFVSTFMLCVILLIVALAVRSPVIGFVVYIGWSIIERVTVTVVQGVYDVHLRYLPMQMSRSLYERLEGRESEYFNPFHSDITEVIIPVLVCSVLVFLARRIFSGTQLKALTD